MPKQTPKCCGRTMRPDGRQFVCSKCKGWNDSGITPAVLLAAFTAAGEARA
ncbi:hypothetical protein [Streptomyces sp. A5-4]|uniref:hypothetical protein n=1 Tax=Streptomyces sp. A5-4 TaxID=3384771 RepID=UPI003DA947C3